MIPYGRQHIDDDDIAAVVDVLQSDYLTTGPKVAEFEQAFAEYVGAKHAIAVSSGTAALHTAMYAIDIDSGDRVIVPTLTFLATANCVVYMGGQPMFCDVNPHTLLIDPDAAVFSLNINAIIAVDYAGQRCPIGQLAMRARELNIPLVIDSAHSIRSAKNGRSKIADIETYSFHPLKHITTGEGGMLVTENDDYAERARRFRNHGINLDHRQRQKQVTWRYAMNEVGYNYRMTDFQAALGISQLRKLDGWIARRREIAQQYNSLFANTPVKPVAQQDLPDAPHLYHLYVVSIPERDRLFRELRVDGIGVNVHYLPVHLQPFYQSEFGTGSDMCPNAERMAKRILTLPLHPGLTDKQVELVASRLLWRLSKCGK